MSPTALPAAHAEVRIDIGGFVGIAPCGPVDNPVAVESWDEYAGHRAEAGRYIVQTAPRRDDPELAADNDFASAPIPPKEGEYAPSVSHSRTASQSRTGMPRFKGLP
jgi:hypothetical protein